LGDRSAEGEQLNKKQIALLRLQQQGLAQPVFKRPEEVVGWLGAVQAQDYRAAKWGVAMRTQGLSNADLDNAFDSGAILRTHVMRPTWHFVTPADIRWMQALTAARVNAANAYYYRRLELDEAVFARSNAILASALQGSHYMRRDELGALLQQAGIDTRDRLRLTYIVLRAELDTVICSGPRRGKQFTYALLEERAPESRTLDHDEALAELTRRYFDGHGPATVQDFAWWSGLTVADIEAGLEMAGPQLAHVVIDEKTYWFSNSMPDNGDPSPSAFLLPNYDEYIIGYTDRSAAFDQQDTKMENPREDIVFNHTILIDGRVAGTWKRSFKKGQILLEARPFASLSAAEEAALALAVQRYGEFHGMPVVLK
jgi:DNA glycosylase AlkZ-like